MTLILVVLLLLILLGGIPAYGYRGDYGYAPISAVGVLLLIVIILLLMRVL